MIYDLQKAGAWKRISAFLFDFIISSVLIVGVVLLLVWASGFEDYSKTYKEKEQSYADKYNIDLNMTSEEYDKMTEDQQMEYIQNLADYSRAFSSDPVAVKAYNMIIYMPFAFVTLGVFFVYILTEFVVPLIFKNGQTLGKKIFGLGVTRTNCVKASNFALFVRMSFGKFVIETMVPLFIAFMTLTGRLNPIIAIVVLLGIIILQMVVFLRTKRTHSLIHDLMSDTAVVDLSTQLVFESEEALMNYKKKLHAEEVAHSPY